ncbi:hypothetical protein GCM10010182_80080 [Actinomadura cremea]|nr:hypothetical protein GCM10010182_80080 [Actinomadura cremea]
MCPQHRQGAGQQSTRHLITTCSREGDLVAEAFTAGKATLACAAHLDRRGVPLMPHFPPAQSLCTRLTDARQVRAQIRPCRPDQIAYRRGTAWHLTSPNGRRQHITPPSTPSPHPVRHRGGLDRWAEDERPYRRPGLDESARPQCAAPATGRRGGPDPLLDARSAHPAHVRARRAGGGR